MRLVAKGKSEPLQGLVQQGKAHVALAKQYAATLIESGWSDSDTAALERDVALLEVTAARAGSQESAGEPSGDASHAVVEAKAFVRRLRNALPRALRETKAEGVSAEIFDAGGKLGREVPRIAAYLERIGPAVAKLEPELRKAFGGKSPVEALEAVKSALGSGAAHQGSAVEKESAEVLSLYEAKGRVLEAIEDLNRAGRIAFEGQAETVGKFNKDILLRARRERASKAA
jgi:hypothetical protein